MTNKSSKSDTTVPASKSAHAKTSDTKTKAASSNPPRSTKIGTVIELLRRSGGATLGELTEATGWQPHSTRAVLTGLRKKGHAIAKSKRGDATCYRITETA